MKTFYTLTLILLASASSFAQPYYIYTATKTGTWNDPSVWSISIRTDGVPKTKVVIPSSYIVSVDNAVNSFGLGDVQINIYGSLAIQPSTTIVLSVASSIQLYGSGKITGTTNTQKITIGGVNKYVGNLDFTKTGSSIASSSTGISPNGFLPMSALPVKFTSFTVTKNASQILLKWSTATEIANDYFAIERSYNGNTWTSVSTIKGAGSSTANNYYSYTDNNANGAVIYYRLKQVDADGKADYSTIKTIRSGTVAAAKIYGTEKNINIELNTEVKNAVYVTVMNTNGQVIEKKQFTSGYKITLNLSKQATGILIVNVTDNNELNQTAKLFF